MNATKLKNGVQLREEFRQGYGGPDTWYVYVEWDNRLLLKETTTSARDCGSLVERLKNRYELLTEGELYTRAESAKQAHPFCEKCRKPCTEGVVYMGVSNSVASARSRAGQETNPTWCSKCADKEPGVIGSAFRKGARVIVNAPLEHKPSLRRRQTNSDIRVPGATGHVTALTQLDQGEEVYLVHYEMPLMSDGYFTEDELTEIQETGGD